MPYTMEKAILSIKQASTRLRAIVALSEQVETDSKKRNKFLASYDMAGDIYDKIQSMNDDILFDESNQSLLNMLFDHFIEIDDLFNEIKGVYISLTERSVIQNTKCSPTASQPNSPVPSLPADTQHSEGSPRGSVHNSLYRSQESLSPHSVCNVKLPRISLPSFNGDLDSWATFYGLFQSLIHDNPSLSNVAKFQYLTACLSHEPLSLIKHLPLTTENYHIAYDAVIQRYQHPRLLVTYYWQSVCNAPKATADSAKSLRNLLNLFSENIHALQQHPTVDLWDFTLLNWFLEKVDSATRKRFEIQYAQISIPKFEDLRQFVSNQCRALETNLATGGDPHRSSPISQPHPRGNQPPQSRAKSFLANVLDKPSANDTCPFCKSAHPPYRCPDFMAKCPSDRQATVKQHRLCFNCLRSHMVSRCSSRSLCRTCNGKHHSLLHNSQQSSSAPTPVRSHPADTQVVATSPSAPSLSANVSSHNTVLLSNSSSPKIVLLSTALVEVCDGFGNYQQCRLLLDPGSQASFITDRCARRLRLPRINSRISILGLGNSESNRSCGLTNCNIRSIPFPEKIVTVDTIVLPEICAHLPNSPLSSEGLNYLNGIQLADPGWNQPAPVDILLGADCYPSLVYGGQLFPPNGVEGPLAMNTCFGWVLLGPTPTAPPMAVNSFFASLEFPVEETLKKFWEIEQVSSKEHTSAEEEKAESIFRDTHTRDISGRFSVRLPFKTKEPTFTNTITRADRRFASLERRLVSQPVLRNLYIDFLQDYLDSGHLSLLTTPPDEGKSYYIPHHCVLKTDADIPKIRVVFDASSKDDNGLSLNDTQLVGTKLQADISSVLLHFRSHKFVFTCDVKQMFRQIRVVDEHCPYQLIRWRFSPDEPVQTYRLNTVTYGVSSSPFLAIRTLLQLASDGSSTHPLAVAALRSSLYVDDMACGADTLPDTLELRTQLIELLRTGCFELRKWSSNHPALLSDIPLSHRQSQHLTFDNDTDTVIKVLGLQWQSAQDCFSFEVKSIDSPCTKRTILSKVARIYDPLGFLCPLTLFAKKLIQHLWILGLGWDEQPPDDVCARWNQFQSELQVVSGIKVPRLLLVNSADSCQLHAFCDASENGYACVCYFRLMDRDGHITVSLVIAKSKVAPVRRLSIPRLELCAATLLSNLVEFLLNTYQDRVKFQKIVAWSDSTVALHWIRSSPHRWKTFVANRVSHIQDKVSPECWRHVSSSDNPADPASRGLLPEDLSRSSLWWAGPSWLSEPCELWPTDRSREVSVSVESEEKHIVLIAQTEPTLVESLLMRFSSLRKIQAIVAYCLRFSKNCQTTGSLSGHLSAFEYQKALLVLVKEVQHTVFASDISKFLKGESLPKHLQKLSPFVDNEGILRVGGRLSHSELVYTSKHPALLPCNHRLTDLIIQYTHLSNLHSGSSTTIYLIQQNFWILGARRAVRKILSQCTYCFKLRPSALVPQMGNLPHTRVSQAKPFSVVGVDFAGPFHVIPRRTRGVKSFKCYLCLFVCFATKALHLELVSDMSTPTFLAALRRFIARRGRCSTIYSDCGTNFVGANKELISGMKLASEAEAIQWHFNPPSSPHFGGLWESGVKSVKTHLYRVIGNQTLTYEELTTLVTQIEALLNSRPLCALSTDPNDLESLTPGHFLTLEPLSAPADPDLSHLSIARLSRWQLIQQLQQSFWSRWKNEYLHTLSQRGKWYTSKSVADSDIGTLVLIKDDNTPPLKWRLARIVAIHPGQDGIARVASVHTKSGVIKRPCVKLCPLPNQ